MSQGLWPGHVQTMETTNYLHLSAKGTVQIFKNLNSGAIWQKRFPILCLPHLFSYPGAGKRSQRGEEEGRDQKKPDFGLCSQKSRC